jgi:hypothetical protein
MVEKPILAAAAILIALLWPPAVLPAGQPTAVSNLPVALTGRHKERGKRESKGQPPQAGKKDAGAGADNEKK